MIESVDGSSVPLHHHISREEGSFILDLFKRFVRNGKIVEIGCANRLSSMHIGEALRDRADAEHIIIDPLQSTLHQSRGLHQMARANHESYRLI